MEQQPVPQSVRFSSLALAVVLFTVLGALALRAQAETDAPVACTMDAKVCPDGSAVGRVAPDCAFAPCPGVVREQRKENIQERKDFVEDARQERVDFNEATIERVQAVRAEGATPNAIPELRKEVAEERAAMTEEQREEARALWEQNRDDMKGAMDEKREELKQKQEERKAAMEEKREDMKARLALQAQARLGAMVERMTDRMNGALERLAAVADKIQGRIDKIEAEHDIDLSEAESVLGDAEALIAAARDDVAYVGTVAEEILASDDPKAHMDELRAAAQLAKESIKAAHEGLREAVQAIRDIAGDSLGTKGDDTSETEEEMGDESEASDEDVEDEETADEDEEESDVDDESAEETTE